MFRGINECRIVNDVADRKNFVKRLGELAAGTKTGIYAWVLMTHHAHILLRSAEIGISGFKRRLLTVNAISYMSKRASLKGVGRSLSAVG